MSHELTYTLGDLRFRGYLALPETDSFPAPGVLIAPSWAGCSALAQQKARSLAEKGYVAMVLDPYGEGQTGATAEACEALMSPLMQHRDLLLERLKAALNALALRPDVDSTRIVALGYCFGGLCVLDLARCGAALAGVISVHGLFTPPGIKGDAPINTKIMILHGFEDPMASPEDALGLGRELTERQADWQLHLFGSTMHAFTNPEANNPDFGTVFSPLADARSERLIEDFMAEVLK